MAKRRRTATRSLSTISRNQGFDDMLAGAFARNGINTLLLDLKEDIGGLVAGFKHMVAEQDAARDSRVDMHKKLDAVRSDCAGLKQTVDRIAPLVDQHEGDRREKIGEGKLIARLLGHITKGRALLGALGGLGLFSWWKWDWLTKL